MAVFFTRGRKAPYQQHVGFSLDNYLTEQTRAELRLRLKHYVEEFDVPETIAARLNKILKSESVSVWGAKEKHASIFEEMQEGDLTIFADTSKKELDHCLEVDLTLGDETPEGLRKDISNKIWRDDSFKYIWFSEDPIEQLSYPTKDLENLIQNVDSDFVFPDTWFSMGDDFHRLESEILFELGGQSEFKSKISTNSTLISSGKPNNCLLLNSENIEEQDHWAVAAKFTDQNGITAQTSNFDQYKGGSDDRVRYFFIDKKSKFADTLEKRENDAIVLIQKDGVVRYQGRLATVEGKRMNGGTSALATLYDIRETTPVQIQSILDSSQTSRISPGTAPLIELERNEYIHYRRQVHGKNLQEKIREIADNEPLQSEIYTEAAAHLIAGRNVVFYGPPGTGKTRAAQELTKALDIGIDIATANAEWSNYDVVGGYEPAGSNNPNKQWNSEPGFLSNAAITCGEKLRSAGELHWLVIDEINRANLDQAFGDVFTLLDIDYRLEKPLRYGDKSVDLPLAFRLITTMNTSDQAKLFSLGYAFRRRFAFVRVPPLFTSTESNLVEQPADPGSPDIPNQSEIREIVRKAVKDNLSRKRLVPEAWDDTKLPNEDAAALDPTFSDGEVIEDTLEKVLTDIDYGWNERDPIDVTLEVVYSLSNDEYNIVDVGQALIIDVIMYLVAAQLIQESNITRTTVDRALIAYVLPQVDEFMSQLRKEDMVRVGDVEEDAASDRFEKFIKYVKKLGLDGFASELESAGESYSIL